MQKHLLCNSLSELLFPPSTLQPGAARKHFPTVTSYFTLNNKLIFQKYSSWLSSIILVLSIALPLNLGFCGAIDPCPAAYSWGTWQGGCCQVLQQHTLNSWVCTSRCNPVRKPTHAGFPVDPRTERGTYAPCSALSWSSHCLFLTFQPENSCAVAAKIKQPAENEESTMVLPTLLSRYRHMDYNMFIFSPGRSDASCLGAPALNSCNCSLSYK